MARSAILPGNEIDKLTSFGLPLWQRGRGDFKIGFLDSPITVLGLPAAGRMAAARYDNYPE